MWRLTIESDVDCAPGREVTGQGGALERSVPGALHGERFEELGELGAGGGV